MAGKVKSGARRIISLVLVLVMCISLLPTSVSAAETESDAAAAVTVEDSDLESTVSDEKSSVAVSEEVSGTNDVGELLAAELNSSTSDQSSADDYIIDVEIDKEESTATVSYMIGEESIDAELYVMIYEEGGGFSYSCSVDGSQLDCSANPGYGNMAISSDDNEATLDISWSGDVLEYFMVYVAICLEDGETADDWICSYESSLYTQEMQELLEKTTDDFDEELVLNMDNDKTNNFLVYSEDTILLYEKTDQNLVTDNEDGTYTVIEADETFQGLSGGDIFAYEYLDGDVLIVSVESATVDGTTVTIVENEEQEIYDVFDYVKIYSDGSDAEVTYSTEELAEGLACGITDESEDGYNLVTVSSLNAEGDEYTASLLSRTYQLNWLDKKSDGGDDNVEYAVKVTGTLSLNLGARVKFYNTPDYQYISVAVDYKTGANITATGEFSYTLPLGSLTAYLAGGCLVLTITPQVKMSASGKVVVDTAVSGTVGVSYSSNNGYCNITTKPVSSVKTEIEGSIYVGLAMEEKLSLLHEKVANASMTEEVGVKVDMALEKTNESDSETVVDYSAHDCVVCYSGSVTSVYNLTFAFTIASVSLGEPRNFDKTYKLYDFYYSQTYNEFGKGKCPYKSYLCTIYVTDTSGLPFDSFYLDIRGSYLCGDTTYEYVACPVYPAENFAGASFAEVFLHSGTYDVVVYAEDETGRTYQKTDSIVIDGGPQVVRVEITRDTEDDDGNSGSGYSEWNDGDECSAEAWAEDSVEGDFYYDVTVDISSCVVSLEYSSTTYDGTEKTPTVSVSYGGTTLTEGTDYMLEYYDNIDAGTADVWVCGIGDFGGCCKQNFIIKKATPTLKLSASSASLNVGGTKTLTCTTNSNGKITYASGKTSVATVGKTSGTVTAKALGSAVITASVAESTNYYAASATCIVSVGLAAPTISSVTQSKTNVTVKWSKVNGAKGYYVYRSTSKSGTYTKIKTISSSSTVSYKDTASKTSGKTYYYKVYAYSGSTKSSASSAKSIVYMKGTVSSLTNTSSGITVKWSKVSGATGYKIYRKSSSASSYSLVKTITKASTTSYTDTKVKSNNGTTYTYYVQPYNSLSKGAYATKKTVRLTAVSISSLKNTASKTLTVKYKINSKATGYQIQYSTSNTFASSKTKSVSVTKASTLSKKLTKLTNGKKYYVRIRAYKKVSDTKYYSAWSSAKSAKVSK